MRTGARSRRGPSIAIGLLVVGLGTLVPRIPVAADAGSGVATVWKLVSADCPTGQAQAGRACYDTGGYLDPSTWSVEESAATWDEPNQWSGDYTYDMPDTISGDGVAAPISVRSTSYENSNVLLQVCVKDGGYINVENDDPCARAEAGPAEAATGSATLDLLPGTAATDTLDIVKVSPQDGPYIYFTYRATNPARTVSYNFSADHDTSSPESPDFAIQGNGTFHVHPPSGEGSHRDGNATLKMHLKGDTWTAKLELEKASIPDEDSARTHPAIVGGVYVVTHSRIHCLKRGDTVKWRASPRTAHGHAKVVVAVPSCNVQISGHPSVALLNTAS